MVQAKSDRKSEWALRGAAARLEEIRAEIAEIFKAFPQLRFQRAGSRSVKAARQGSERTATAPTRRRRMSKEWRAKLAAATKRRWAEAKKAGRKGL